MRRTAGAALMIAAVLGAAAAATAQEAPRVRVVTDISAAGMAGDRWLAMLRKRLPDSSYRAIADLARPLSPRERRWADLIRARRADWEKGIAELTEPYAPAPPPVMALIVLGNRGGEDAFVHDRATIGFDLSALDANYGDPDDPENRARIDRFFRHEYAHLLQKAWIAAHPAPDESPLDLALLDIWTEGLGNYHSLSPRWRGADGSLTVHAKETLETLEPRLIVRLAALACARPEAGAHLTADLSTGPFGEKWGALPAALWLTADEAGAPGALRRLVLAGPSGVWPLAERQIHPAFRPVLREIRAAAAQCARPSQR